MGEMQRVCFGPIMAFAGNLSSSVCRGELYLSMVIDLEKHIYVDSLYSSMGQSVGCQNVKDNETGTQLIMF